MVLARCRQIAAALRAAGGRVVATRMRWTAQCPPPRQPVSRMMPVLREGPAAGWDEIAPEIEAIADAVVDHAGWDAFHRTTLADELNGTGVAQVILAGLTSNFAIESTARGAWERGLRVLVAEDAITGISDAGHGFALAETLPRLGFPHPTDAIVAALDAAAHTGDQHGH